MKEEYKKLGYKIEQSITGYYKLFKGEELIHDDSACEDVYDIETASELFNAIISEREN